MSGRALAPWLVAGAAFALAVSRAPSDSDMWWHLASGRWMVEHRELLRHDVFSSTVAGEPYSVGEWLGQIVLYLAYAGAGWSGVVLLRGVLVATAALFLMRATLRTGAPLSFAIAVVAPALALSAIVWTDRPQLFTLAFVPLLLDVLLAARAGGVRRLAVVPPLLLVWTNLHGGYALGLALVAVFALDAIVRRTNVRAFVVIAALGSLATLVDPGALGIGGALGHVAAPPRYIQEESPPDLRTPAGAVFAFFVVVTTVVAVRARATPFDLLLLVPVLVLAASAQRHMPYFPFVAAPFLSSALPRAAGWRRTAGREPPRAVIGGAVGGVAAVVLGSLLTLPAAPDEHAYPAGAIARLDTTRPQLFNEYDWGGYLIWRAPGHPVFIDGRLFPYLPDVLDDFQRVVTASPGYRDVLLRRGIATVLIRPGRPLVGALRAEGWRAIASGDGWVLLTAP